MNRWTRSNPLAAVPGYKVPRGHFANGYTNGGDRVGFKVGGRVGLKRGSRKKPPEADKRGRDQQGHLMPRPHKRAGAGKILFSRRERTKWTPGRGRPSKYPGEKNYFGTAPLKQKPKDFQEGKPKIYTKHWTKKAEGGRIGLKKGSNKNWIQKAVNPKHKGFCTPMTKKTCTPKRKALAKTFKKMGRARKGKA